MAYLVIAYPKLNKHDYDWIQKYRHANDAIYFSVVEPHITLVFSIDNISKNEFVDEVKRQIIDIAPFGFVMKVATINKNDFGAYFHEFIVPDTGYSNIVKLHDKLYSGLFKPHHRFDLDFIPHIGIGNSDNVSVSKTRVDELNCQNISIQGRVETIDVIEYIDNKITTIESINL